MGSKIESERNSHSAECSVDGGAANLDRDDGVQCAHGSLEGLQMRVLIGEDTEETVVDTKADAGVDVLFRGLEPSITLGL